MTRLYSEDVELYDIAFSWDASDELAWLLERLGPECRSVLEPGCGTGRMVEALARAGLEVVGIDNAPSMVEYARARLAAAGVEAAVVEADMTTFELGREFDGAVCPINTLLHLTREELGLHLESVARHLVPGARYLAQVGIFDGEGLPPPSEWNAERDGIGIRVTWAPLGRDPAHEREEHRSRIEFTSGPRAGEVIEESHVMTAWTSSAWRDAIAASPFTEVAAYDGSESGRPQIELERGGGLMWHELLAP